MAAERSALTMIPINAMDTITITTLEPELFNFLNETSNSESFISITLSALSTLTLPESKDSWILVSTTS